MENVQYTLDWKNPNPLVSELFFDVSDNWLSRLTKVSLLPDARIDTDDCFVLSTEDKKTTVWIRKKDFLVKQKREESNHNVVASPQSSANSSDSRLRMIPARTLRESANPLSPLPSIQSLAAVPPGIISPQHATPDGKPSRTFSLDRTQTFREIIANEPLRKQDFSPASMPLLSDRNDPKARKNLGEALMLSGKNEQALEEFLWCWDHGKEDKSFIGTRVTFLLMDISKLGTNYPAAFDALRKRRDAIEKKLIEEKDGIDEINDLSHLNETLKNSGRTLSLFDRLPINSSVRKKLGSHLISQLIEAKRYKEILSFLDPEKALEEGMEKRRRFTDMQARFSRGGVSPGDEYMRKRTLESWSQYFEVLAGANQTDRAKKMADTILKFDPASDTRALLEKAARHADNEELATYLHAQ